MEAIATATLHRWPSKGARSSAWRLGTSTVIQSLTTLKSSWTRIKGSGTEVSAPDQTLSGKKVAPQCSHWRRLAQLGEIIRRVRRPSSTFRIWTCRCLIHHTASVVKPDNAYVQKKVTDRLKTSRTTSFLKTTMTRTASLRMTTPPILSHCRAWGRAQAHQAAHRSFRARYLTPSLRPPPGIQFLRSSSSSQRPNPATTTPTPVPCAKSISMRVSTIPSH